MLLVPQDKLAYSGLGSLAKHVSKQEICLVLRPFRTSIVMGVKKDGVDLMGVDNSAVFIRVDFSGLMDRSSSSLMTTYWSGATSIPLTISSDGTSSVHASHHFLYRIGESLSLCKSSVLSGFCSIAEYSFMG